MSQTTVGRPVRSQTNGRRNTLCRKMVDVKGTKRVVVLQGPLLALLDARARLDGGQKTEDKTTETGRTEFVPL